ncbi:uncharacterized protein LOC127875445 isoform X2 [Dreissena polymorpha]|uniref:Copper acquisition factor BIM1-like domain-containing protein n=1 Tax=Dreissena polymorpha TaxID=45954 RepID=A0A9D4LA36_DREPO|nr:uncharacterized protein LOC127875445 isoform X2 [Dreissena polymorpha]KAH3854029.1 hypothetical protein DPMN_096568 [Dreissena polymorpha]
MKVLISSAFFLGLVALGSTHLCLVFPQQRGNVTGLDAAAAPDCYRVTGPCGGMDTAGHVRTVFQEGDMVSITYQKNAGHWVAATPGYFAISLIKLSNHGGTLSAPQELKRREDKNEPNLTIFSDAVQLPAGVHGHHIIQVTYVTNNPAAPAVFYQCADVTINTRTGGGVVG